MNIYEPHKSSIGNIDANVMALIAYGAAIVVIFIPGIKIIAWLAPIVIYILEKDSNFVKFHAMQAFLINIVGIIFSSIIFMIIGGSLGLMFFRPLAYGALGTILLSAIITGIVAIVITIFEIISMVKCYEYKEYEIPLIGIMARKIAHKNY
ncbi:DUF4870 domain-containing protein [Clostridium sp.]|uniref:DUF4870 domain-containing protein n=1 Tax=Clostridium sp. TaxID=1506 RepID=UPI0034639B20